MNKKARTSFWRNALNTFEMEYKTFTLRNRTNEVRRARRSEWTIRSS